MYSADLIVHYCAEILYRDEIYSPQILLSWTQAGAGRTDKQEREEISPNHVQRINLISVRRGAESAFWKVQPVLFLRMCVRGVSVGNHMDIVS